MKIEVCSMMRHHNYADFVEWVRYYLSLGFDRITIIDNQSDFPLKEAVLDNFMDIKVGRIVVLTMGGDNCYQNELFGHYHGWTDFDWVLYCDDDEYLYFDRSAYPDVHAFLEHYIGANPEDMECLSLYWKFYGPKNYMVQRPEGKTALELFTAVFDYSHHSIMDIGQKTLVKSFFKKNCRMTNHENHFPNDNGHIYDIFGERLAEYKGNDSMVFSADTPCIMHLYYKSESEWIAKHRRRSCSGRNRTYPGSDKSDEELRREYIKIFSYFR